MPLVGGEVEPAGRLALVAGAKGLMWLSLARDGVTDRARDGWILELYAKAEDTASDADRQVAAGYVDDHRRR